MKGNFNEQIKNNFNNGNNIIDNLTIISTNYRCSNFIEKNVNYGVEFEHSIAIKSCLNLNIHSINNNQIYTKEYRKFYGLKLVVIKNQKYYLIPKCLDKGKFKVIPFSNKYFRLKYLNCIPLFISYNSEGVFVVKEDFKNYFYYDNTSYYDYHTKTKTAKNDAYEGYIHLKDNYSNIIEIFIYSSSCEVDCLFEVESDFDINKFQINKTYSNNNTSIIRKNCIMIYEIKTGDQVEELVNHIYEKGFFIYKYIQSISNKKIVFIGFFRRNSDYSSNNNTKENQGNDEKNKIKNTHNINYKLLDNFPFIIYTFEIKDSIFGEKLKYEKEELNVINNVNKRINNLEGRVNNMDLKIKKNSKILNEIYNEGKNNNQKISSIENKITGIENIIRDINEKLKGILKKKFNEGNNSY